MRATGGRVPSRLEAAVTATSRVRSVTTSSRSSRSSSAVAGSSRSQRTVTPVASAAWIHGRTLESWSSSLTTTSSPGCHVLASIRETSYVSWVALRPWTTPSGTARGGRRPRDGSPARRPPRCAGSPVRSRAGTADRSGCGRSPRRRRRGLGAAGSVEVGDARGERGELGAEGSDVERHARTQPDG